MGEINGSSFSLRRNIQYRNSFLPQIRGNVQAAPSGSSVRITMFMHPFTAVFMLIWLWGVGGIAWSGSLRAESSPTALHFVPVGMFIFGIALVVGGFFPEAIKAKRMLAAALGEAGDAYPLRQGDLPSAGPLRRTLGVMRFADRIRQALRKLPAPIVVAAVFVGVIAVGVILVFVLPPKPDPWAECRKQCEPRFSRIAPNKDYPMSAKGHYRQICECY